MRYLSGSPCSRHNCRSAANREFEVDVWEVLPRTHCGKCPAFGELRTQDSLPVDHNNNHNDRHGIHASKTVRKNPGATRRVTDPSGLVRKPVHHLTQFRTLAAVLSRTGLGSGRVPARERPAARFGRPSSTAALDR